MPRHGVFPVHLLVEHTLYSWIYTGHNPTAYLAPLRPEERDAEFAERVRTTRSLLMACQESRHETKRRFPNALRYHNVEMRFNGEKDLVYLPQGHPAPLPPDELRLAPAWPDAVMFANAWNTVVQRLAIESESTCYAFGMMPEHTYSLLHRECVPTINKFMAYLTKFTLLKQLVLVIPRCVCTRTWRGFMAPSPSSLRDRLRKVRDGDATWCCTGGRPPWNEVVVKSLKSVIHADREAERHARHRAQFHRIRLDRMVKFGYPELCHLDVVLWAICAMG